MSHVSMSQSLQEVVNKVMSNQADNVLLMRMSLISEDKSMSIEVGSPDRLDIVRNFEDGYSDYIEIEFDLTPKEYVQVMKNYKDLRCVIKVFITETTLKKMDEPLKTINSRIVFKEKLDLFKTISKDKIIAAEDEIEQERHLSTRIPIVAQLMDPIEYKFRKMRCNGLHPNITILEALKVYTHQFGIGGIKVAKPNNSKVYENFLIEPIKNISNLFGYIQERYGVYEKGICYYVHNNIMYIYPNYELNMIDVWETDIIHVYSVDKSVYSSAQCFHNVIDEELNIVSNSNVIDHDPQAIYAEEIANTILVDFKDELMSKPDTLNADKVSVNLTDRIKVLELSEIETMSTNTLSIRYGMSYGNHYPIMTELNRLRSVMTGFSWEMANPFATDIKPGSQWYYHFDGEDGYKVVPATCRQLIYNITMIGQQGHDKIYGTKCTISLYTGKEKK